MEDPDELIPCPFEPVHILQRKRMPYHIIKCRKNQPQKHFRACPFNHRHVIHRNEFAAHLQTCPDQGIVEREITHKRHVTAGVSVVQKGYTNVPVSSFVPPSPSEDWGTSDTVVMVGEYNTQSSDSDMEVSQNDKGHMAGEDHADRREEGVARRLPEPRLPINSGALSEVIQLAGAAAAQSVSEVSPPRARGRGRGREFLVSEASNLPPVGGLSAQVGGPSSYAPQLVRNESPVRVGRGRGMFKTEEFRALEEMRAEERMKALKEKEMAERYEQGMGRQLEEEEARKKQAQEMAEREAEEVLVKKKRERKLKKMLRQIQDLEEKRGQGEELDSDQLAKIGRKDDVLHELAASQQPQ